MGAAATVRQREAVGDEPEVAAVAGDPMLRLSTTSSFSAVSTTGSAFIGSATTAATNLMSAS